MGRKRLPEGEKLESFTIQIKGKYLNNQNLDDLRLVAQESVIKYVELSKLKNN